MQKPTRNIWCVVQIRGEIKFWCRENYLVKIGVIESFFKRKKQVYIFWFSSDNWCLSITNCSSTLLQLSNRLKLVFLMGGAFYCAYMCKCVLICACAICICAYMCIFAYMCICAYICICAIFIHAYVHGGEGFVVNIFADGPAFDQRASFKTSNMESSRSWSGVTFCLR